MKNEKMSMEKVTAFPIDHTEQTQTGNRLPSDCIGLCLKVNPDIIPLTATMLIVCTTIHARMISLDRFSTTNTAKLGRIGIELVATIVWHCEFVVMQAFSECRAYAVPFGAIRARFTAHPDQPASYPECPTQGATPQTHPA